MLQQVVTLLLVERLTVVTRSNRNLVRACLRARVGTAYYNDAQFIILCGVTINLHPSLGRVCALFICC